MTVEKKITPSDKKTSSDQSEKKGQSIYSFFRVGSIFQWALIVLFMVTLPLILTMLYSVWSIKEYTSQGTTLVLTIQGVNNTKVLRDKLSDMERSIKQYKVLDELEIFGVFEEHHQGFLKISSLTNFNNLPKPFQYSFMKLKKNEMQLHTHILNLSSSVTEVLSEKDISRYEQLRLNADEIVMHGEWQINLQTEALAKIATQVIDRVTMASLVSVVLGLVLGPLSFLYLINKPIKSIGLAIRRLGNADLDKRIDIEGPSDLLRVGHYLEWLRNRLNQLENNKQFFIKTISHELKTPLASMVEGTGLLHDEVVGELNAEQLKIVELLQIANINLRGLIENLLEYQRATSILNIINLSSFDLRKVIDGLCSDFQLLLNRKNVSVEIEGEIAEIIADRDKIKIIISNLLSNALKFSPVDGRILFKLEVVGDYFNMLIADQGTGIAKEQVPYIFTEFYQQETPDDWKVKGSGLGLSLVKGYVEAHHGKIELLESDEQYCGAHFLIILPLLR